MNKLIQELVKYIEEQVKSVITASGGGDARFAFVGAPIEILRQTMSYFLDHGGISVTINSENRFVPVYLLDHTNNNPEGINSGICDDAHLTNVRNSCPYFLALIPSHKLENKSISTSTTKIGVTQLREGQKWGKDPLISELIESALVSRGQSLEVFNDCIENILDDAEKLDEHKNDCVWQWRILNVLFNIGNPKNDGFDEVIAACGLPRTSPEKINTAKQIIKSIAEKIASEGLLNFFERLSESHLEEIFADQKDMIDSIRLALGDFRTHLLQQAGATVPMFEDASHVYYSPYRTCNNADELPEWWKLLTVDVWDKLLEDDDIPPPTEEINVKLENALFNAKKGHPAVVREIPSFRIEPTVSGVLPAIVVVERGVGTRTMSPIGEIKTDVTRQWQDNEPPSHEKNLRYKFSAHDNQLKEHVSRLISIEHFLPGVVIDTNTAKKVTILKRAKGTTLKKAVWECDITLLGKDAQHHFDIYFNSKVELTNTVHYFNSSGKRLFEDHFHSEQEGKNQVVLDLGEEGYIELTGTIKDSKREFIIRVQVHLEDIETSGVGSWFEKLVELHCTNSSNFSKYTIDVNWPKSQQLAKWILDDRYSYYPLVMGYDYRDNWKNPRWDSMPVMSSFTFSNDIRPRKEDFMPPVNLLECRESVRKLVNGEDGVIELVNLGELANNPINVEKIVSYMRAYSEWLKTDRNNALWFDTVVIIGPEATGSVLSQQPDAILLNPLHPIRIGWQFLAQHTLYASLMRQKHCPAAGVFDPCLTPDSMMLPCWTAGQQVHPLNFISVANNSDYWSVLWNGSAIDNLGNKDIGDFFDEDFGIKIDGIAAGFTLSQVDRALNDIAMIRSARACLKLRLIDDTMGSSSCTEGITKWTSANLGENNQWVNAGPTSLEVYDARNKLQWPSTRQVANLTGDTLATMRWFAGGKKNADAIDLTIINHLGSMSPELAKHDISSAVGLGTLIRQRIRRQLPKQTGSQFISESRKSPPRKKVGDALSQVIEYLSWQIEDTCNDTDSFIFAPKMIKIQENLRESRYCAVSSTIIDPSCFFDADENAYLWDYDMPAYARRTGSNNGYYLIASETQAILQAVRRNLSEIAPSGRQLDDDMVRLILREISRRGFPTLKRLVTQGATSTGEIGLLVALRLLQNHQISASLFPIVEDKYVNLIIPIDPFRNMIAGLKGKLGMSGSRPDILAVSIHHHLHQISVKFTPIEVKHRSGILVENEKKAALEQASEFSRFMAKMESLAEVEPIWNIALTRLLTTMIDFGFRSTSVVQGTETSKEWAKIHSAALQALMTGEAKKETDTRGRLIIVEQSLSNTIDLDNDSFKETLVIHSNDAFKIISSDEADILKKIKNILNNWELLAIPQSIETAIPGKINKDEMQVAGVITQPDSYTLTSEEIPPTGEVRPSNLETNHHQGLISPSILDQQDMGVHFPVGKDITSPLQEPEVYFHPSNTQLNQLNTGIVGDLGTGKTQLTKSLIYQFIKSEEKNRGIRPKFLIFDYKGDYIDHKFIDSVSGCVVKPHRIPLNLFDISDKKTVANPIIDTVSFFNDVISKIYKIEKPNQQYLLKEAIKACYGSLHIGKGYYPNIYDVYNAYKIKIGGKAVDSTLSILSDIVDRELFVQETSGVVPFKEFFNGVTVIDLKSLGQDDNTKNMLVVIFLHLFYDYMLKIEKKAPIAIGDKLILRVIDSMLLVDEANSIMKYNFDVLNNILLQGREFGVGVLLASQYLSHFRTSQNNYAEPLLTWFIHKVPNITKKELESIGFENVDTDVIARIKTLKLHECLFKSLGSCEKGTFIYGYPFYKISNS